MKAKLIKTEGSYILKDGLLHVVGVDDKNLKERLNCNYLLSTKNCQAIERGYDLHELAVAWAETVYEEIADSVNILDSEEIFIADTPAFKAGFQKAVEILGDKKFTEEDMIKFMQYIISNETLDNTSSVSSTTAKFYLDKFQSLQQNEWEVEVEMVDITETFNNSLDLMCPHSTSEHSETTSARRFPKLDADGCLILKRVV